MMNIPNLNAFQQDLWDLYTFVKGEMSMQMENVTFP